MTEPGIVMFFNEEHDSNALSPIDVTEFGIFILIKDEHFKNAAFSIVDTFSPMITIFKFEQL